MNNEILITIGILNYNGVTFLKEVIPSVLSLNYPKLEIIIFDQNSSDESCAFLENYTKIRLIKSDKNLGYGEGKNKLVDYSQGKYVLLIDNDIKFINPDTINELLNFYQSRPKISFLSIPLLDKNASSTEHYGLFYTSMKKNISINEILNLNAFNSGGFIGGVVFFDRQIFKELGGFDTIYPFNIDDYDLSARSWIAGYEIFILPNIYAEHLGISTRINIKSWSWKNQYYYSGFSRMMFKNYSLKNLIIWFPFTSLYIFYKSLKRSIQFLSFQPLLSFLKSLYFFLRDLPDTLNKRQQLQSKRLVQNDIFLNIKPLKIK